MNTQAQFVKVHAAEYLLWSGHPEGVGNTFTEEQQRSDTIKPYRIGIWRVLAQADSNAAEKKRWVEKIMQVFTDTTAVDRINAAETLAKLGVSPLAEYPDITRDAITGDNAALALYTHWAAAVSGKDSMNACRDEMMQLITSAGQEDTLQRTLAAYILHHLGNLGAGEWKSLAASALSEPAGNLPKANLLCAAYLLTPQDSLESRTYRQVKKALTAEQDSPKTGNRTQMALALAERGDKDDIPVLISMMHHDHPLKEAADNADVGAAAAYAILKIDSRYRQ